MAKWAYVGYCKGCGAVSGAIFEDSPHADEFAVDMVKLDLRVEHVDTDQADVKFSLCTCEKKKKELDHEATD